jgi:hypothetical protein
MKGNTRVTIIISNAYIAGRSDDNTAGFRPGGTYIPAYLKNGVFVPARWYGQITFNKDYYLEDGTIKEVAEYHNLTVWNNAERTKSGQNTGMADSFARLGCCGARLTHIKLATNQHKGNVWDEVAKKYAQRADGSFIQDLKNDFVLIDGDEADFDTNISKSEFRRQESLWNDSFAGKPCFFARKPGMNAEETTAFNSLRKSVRYQPGAPYYGFAKVELQSGAILAHGIIPGSASQVNPGSPAPAANNGLGVDMNNPAVVAALQAAGLLPGTVTTPKVASASPAMSGESLVPDGQGGVPY